MERKIVLIDPLLNYIDISEWKEVFKDIRDELVKISEYLEDREYYPRPRDVFKVFNLCTPDSIRVVILGQDPYYSLSKDGKQMLADGLPFSICSDLPDTRPSSISNILREVNRCGYPKKDTSLYNWARQGVFLLNKALTVEPGKPGSDLKLWKKFTLHVLSYICKKRDIIWLIWGNLDPVYKKLLKETGQKYILETTHPSNQSAHKGFHGCGHFKKVNEILLEIHREEIHLEEIDWSS